MATDEGDAFAVVRTALATPSAAVLAPPFPQHHASWESFEANLKAYSQDTYQLYVIRTTTSVRRRNHRILELASSNAAGVAHEGEDGGLTLPATTSERALIPEHWQWYSKTLMCTHGWKDRQRGTGKRSITMVRSTGCPVKMCVTLQQGGDENGWQVVVTKHMRTHNHPLSKELYLFYTENRRIYDPELLALVGGAPLEGGGGDGADQMFSDVSNARFTSQRIDILDDEDDDDHYRAAGLAALQDDPVPGTVVTLPKMSTKVFDSWESFQHALVAYATATQQHFRMRSTISVNSKNGKLMDHAIKVGKSGDDILRQLIPDTQKWYSKLLICNHGWKRKSRSKVAQFQAKGKQPATDNSNACPAMLMARLQRDVHDNWRIVVNRQVVHHNHPIHTESSGGVHDEDETAGDAFMEHGVVDDGMEEDDLDHDRNESDAELADAVESLHSMEELPRESESAVAATSAAMDEVDEASEEFQQTEIEDEPVPKPMSVTEVVVRVPKLPPAYDSWDAFHEHLQQYSAATYQSYRTRTTSSIKGRNQKILEMKANASTNTTGQKQTNDLSGENARLIPEEYKWYSKTLTCTHGWKERRRGSGKRTVHIVRSTSCPVKICATLQYVDSAGSGARGTTAQGTWRVIVTKHVVDHNHNLSRELYQHYCDNRRIYDPELLAIDQTSAVPPPTSGPLGGMNSDLSHLSSASMASFNAALQSIDPTGSLMQLHQATMPDAAYIPGNTLQMQQNAAAGGALMSFGPLQLPPSDGNGNQNSILLGGIPTSSVRSGVSMIPSFYSPSLLSAPQFAMLQAAGPAIIDPSTPATSSATSQSGSLPFGVMVTATNVLCRLHGPEANQQSVDGSIDSIDSGQECTCLRIPVVHEYRTSPATQDSSTNQQRRRPRDAEAQATSTDHGKKARKVTSVRVPGLNDSSVIQGHMAQDGGDSAMLGASTPVWGPENLLPVIPVTLEDGVAVWRAPRLKRRHDSWAAFTEYLDAYSHSTYQLYRVRTTSSVNARNTRIMQQLQQQDEAPSEGEDGSDSALPLLVPTSFEWYSKTYVCTHGWKERRRGKGQRVSHNLRSTACPVKICVTLQRDPHDTTTWHVVVTKHVLEHNHEISAALYRKYSENRKIRDPDLMARAEQMWREGVSRRKIYEFLKETTHVGILMKDVHNLVQRWQQQNPRAMGDHEDGEGDEVPSTEQTLEATADHEAMLNEVGL